LKSQEVTMLFDSWAGLGRVLLVGTLAYVALVLLLRISGKRTLGKLNAFDLVVTVALGSTLATSAAQQICGAGGRRAGARPAHPPAIPHRLALGALAAVSGADQGRADPAAAPGPVPRKDDEGGAQTREEILAALRASGAAEPGDIAAVVLETDGTLSVIPDAGANGGAPTLDTVRRLDHARA
jgi:hypothetical protein